MELFCCWGEMNERETYFAFIWILSTNNLYNETALQEVKKYFEILQNSYSIQISEILIW